MYIQHLLCTITVYFHNISPSVFVCVCAHYTIGGAGEEGSVVDLTNDSGVEDAVDLTSPVCYTHTHNTYSMYVIYVIRNTVFYWSSMSDTSQQMGPSCAFLSGGHRERRGRRRGRGREVVVLDESEGDDEVQIMESKQQQQEPTSTR